MVFFIFTMINYYLYSLFSVDDIFAIAQLYKNGNINNVDTFVMGVITASNTQYMLVIDNPNLLRDFANTIITGNRIDAGVLNSYTNLYHYMYNVKPENSIDVNESSFINFLENSRTGLKLLKGDDSMSSWQSIKRDSNGKAVPEKCN